MNQNTEPMGFNMLAVSGAKRKVMLGVFILVPSLFVNTGLYFYYSGRLQNQQRIGYLFESEIKKIEKTIVEIQNFKTEKEGVLARMEIIQHLRNPANDSLAVLPILSALTPADVIFQSLDRVGPKISLQGHAKSLEALSQLLTALENEPRFVNIKYSSKSTSDKVYPYRAKIYFNYQVIEPNDSEKH